MSMVEKILHDAQQIRANKAEGRARKLAVKLHETERLVCERDNEIERLRSEPRYEECAECGKLVGIWTKWELDEAKEEAKELSEGIKFDV